MIVIDTSALLAITNHEPERLRFLELLADADRRMISSVTLLEARIVLHSRFGRAGIDRLNEWLDAMRPEIVAFDLGQAETAFQAFAAFGKGVHARARLNICDCIVYALAKDLNAPLLFKGDDFAATDIRSAFQ